MSLVSQIFLKMCCGIPTPSYGVPSFVSFPPREGSDPDSGGATSSTPSGDSHFKGPNELGLRRVSIPFVF